MHFVHFSDIFLGCFDFLSCACSLGLPVRDPFKLNLVKTTDVKKEKPLVNPLVLQCPLIFIVEHFGNLL